MTDIPTPLQEAENRTAVIVALLAEATTAQERNAVCRTALRAECMWRCHRCKTDHYLTTETCDCGAKRPSRLPG
ncbi:hypothetical protein ACFWH1_18700 [Streptomyces sp. NPDC127037]|uniref:hypothetical protein n=1 Tax=Streptomyces sp. NPDC127037 TaxID=3347113 RepID=UPI00365D0FF4